MHKKFKKMASSAVQESQEAAAQIATSHPATTKQQMTSQPSQIGVTSHPVTPQAQVASHLVTPQPQVTSHPVTTQPLVTSHPVTGPGFVNRFPLKHSALSLVQSAAPVSTSEQPGEAVISSNYRPTPTVLETAVTSSLPEEDDSPGRKRNVCPFCQMVCAKPSVLDKHIRYERLYKQIYARNTF